MLLFCRGTNNGPGEGVGHSLHRPHGDVRTIWVGFFSQKICKNGYIFESVHVGLYIPFRIVREIFCWNNAVNAEILSKSAKRKAIDPGLSN